jgi:carboxyl-terminal processing protease
MLNFPVPDSGFSANNHKNKLKKIIDFIDNEYVDSINTDSIVDLAVTNILDKLDPHSVYIEKNEMTEISQSMKGDFVGIGINFYMLKDTVAVIKPIPNGPSQKAGILAGDRILFANKSQLFGKKMPSDSLFSKLKGEVGSQINLTIYRKSTKKTLRFSVNRDHVAIKSVDIGLMLDKTTGYIKINRFAETTYDEFEKELILLKKQGAKSLVIDLRDNGGGYLEKAVEVADD